MRVEFHQGVPKGCIEWLWNNVGPGNLEPRGDPGIDDWGDSAWLYERVEQKIPSTDPSMDSNIRYIPTIKVKDPKLAMLFALRWS
jgi:hypothetical protein